MGTGVFPLVIAVPEYTRDEYTRAYTKHIRNFLNDKVFFEESFLCDSSLVLQIDSDLEYFRMLPMVSELQTNISEFGQLSSLSEVDPKE